MRLPGFQGTHIPGEHRIVASSPPQIIIPERKITSAESAAKWHATRGGAVAEEEEEAEAVLLTDLVAGWALTGGPEQTLSSGGVIASGPLDFTNTGSVTFGAPGARFTAPSQLLSVASGFSQSDSSFTVECKFRIRAMELFVTYGVALLENTASEWGLSVSPVSTNLLYIEGDGDYPTVNGATPIVAMQTYYAIGWADKDTDTLYLQLDGGAVDTVAAAGPWGATTDSGCAIGNFSAELPVDADVSHVRYWNRVLTGDERTWLCNSGAGRTDAEIAAYTG